MKTLYNRRRLLLFVIITTLTITSVISCILFITNKAKKNSGNNNEETTAEMVKPTSSVSENIDNQTNKNESDKEPEVLSDPLTTNPNISKLNPISPVSINCIEATITRAVLPWHYGIDYAKEDGCWINASMDGIITYASWGDNGEGFYVEIDHGNGIKTNYQHGNGEFAVRKGDSVKKGDSIMYMGCTGNCTGTHLHFELRENDIVLDPLVYFKN